MPLTRRGLVAAALTGLLSPLSFAQTAPEPPRGISVRAVPIEAFSVSDTAQRRFGDLEYRGGLTLSSSNKNFGGYSGLRIAPDGERFVAVSDRGTWLRGRIVYRDGVPSAIADAEIAPLLGEDGRALVERKWFDAEALAQDGDTLYVGFERVNQIVRFNYGKDGLLARGEPIALPNELKSLPHNKGIEALVFAPQGHPMAGALIAISERGLDQAGNIIGYFIGGPRPGAFSVKRLGDYDISDATLLPGGDLVVLERLYSPSRGLWIRLRRIAKAQLQPGATLNGRVLFEADLGYQIDNLEGIAVHRNAAGETILTMISDDNFSLIQRTILLQFALVGD